MTASALPAPDASGGSGPSAAQLDHLLARLDHLLHAIEPVLPMLAKGPDMIATAVDTFDDLAAQGKRRGVDIDERMRLGLHLLERLTHPDTQRRLQVLLDRLPALEALAPMLDEIPAAVGRAQREARPLGLFGVLGAMGDPAVKRSVGLALAVARQLGTPSSNGGAPA